MAHQRQLGELAVPAAARQSSMRRVLAGSIAGTSLEWYDFVLYGNAADRTRRPAASSSGISGIR